MTPTYLDLSGLTELDVWLDANVSQLYKDEPLAQDWARVSKIIEEIGEAIAELIGFTGQNPRKGHSGSPDAMLNEIADVVITGILGIQHFTKYDGATIELIRKRWEYRLEAADQASHSGMAPLFPNTYNPLFNDKPES